MANPDHVNWTEEGPDAWNERWARLRSADDSVRPDLSQTVQVFAPFRGFDLRGADFKQSLLMKSDLREADLRGASFQMCDIMRSEFDGANLTKADFSRAHLIAPSFVGATLIQAKFTGTNSIGADFRDADLSESDLVGAAFDSANFHGADFSGMDLSAVSLTGADLGQAKFQSARLWHAVLSGADLREADLRNANLQRAILVGSDLRGANLSGCSVHGISAWDLIFDGDTNQTDLIITPDDSPQISVDNIEVAQFIYLLLTNNKLREIIDTVSRKAVLILGRFTGERKAILDGLRDALRGRGYVAIIFDFEGPTSRNLTETVSILAHISHFVIADLTDPRSVPHELYSIIPFLPSVPVQPLIEEPEREYGMFQDFVSIRSVLPTYRYANLDSLLQDLDQNIIGPAENLAKQLTALNRRPT